MSGKNLMYDTPDDRNEKDFAWRCQKYLEELWVGPKMWADRFLWVGVNIFATTFLWSNWWYDKPNDMDG